MRSERNIVVTEDVGPYIDDLPVEIVERKGIGHPDTLCDGIAERISTEYSRYCRETYGVVLHHNFDKVQLVAGETEVGYGGGTMIRPIRIQIAGRATPSFEGRPVPIDTIAIRAARCHLEETLRHLDPSSHVVVDSYAGRGAAALQYTVEHTVANDTSFGVSHWPRSDVEHLVYETAQHLNGGLREQFPIGEDVKVMAARTDDRVALTVAVPLICTEIPDADAYAGTLEAIREAVRAYASSLTRRRIDVYVNTADDVDAGSVYLTLTGTSAEQGDDGSVGRGNRVNGVIAPFRATSLEAAAGKNPICHVGKLYNLLALQASRAITERVTEVRSVTVYILSQIGRPLDDPLVATAQVHLNASTLSPAIRDAVSRALNEEIERLPELRERILRREVPVF